MDVKDQLTEVEKQMFENIRIEVLVLRKLQQEKDQQSGNLLGITLKRLGYDPRLYGLEFNFAQNKWELKLRPDVLTIDGPAIPKNLKNN